MYPSQDLQPYKPAIADGVRLKSKETKMFDIAPMAIVSRDSQIFDIPPVVETIPAVDEIVVLENARLIAEQIEIPDHSLVEQSEIHDPRYSQETAFQSSQISTKLPTTHSPLESLLANPPFHVAIASPILRAKVDALPLLDCSGSSLNEAEKRRAFKILSFAATGYIWGDGKLPVLKKLPRQIAVPFQQLGDLFGIAPMACYATTVLWNCSLIDEMKGWVPENVGVELTFTGTWDEEWFYGLSACVESVGSGAMNDLISVASSIRSGSATTHSETNAIVDRLTQAHQCLKHMVNLLGRVFEMNSETFYWRMRPYFAGWGIIPSTEAHLRGGVRYEGVDSDGETRHYVGISAAQSSLFQCLDALLGVKHKDAQATMLRNTRAHMPGDHRGVVEDLETMYGDTIQSFVASSPAALAAYNNCVGELSRFRAVHLAAATKFAVREANRAGKSSFGLAKSSADGGGAIGAGGSTLQPFLRDLVLRTKAAKVTAMPVPVRSMATATATTIPMEEDLKVVPSLAAKPLA